MVARSDNRLLWDRGRLGSPHTQVDKSDRVRGMFDAIAPTYELVNRVFSLGRDGAWRRRAVGLCSPLPGDRVLDVACGTGDFARAFRAWRGGVGAVVGCDFSRPMLDRAVAGAATGIRWMSGDALALPFASSAFSITSCAFGVRNFHDLGAGLREMYRVLEPGGRCVILEFTRPSNALVRWAYEFYASNVMPLGATLVSGDRTGAYRYLPKSVVSFPGVGAMCDSLRAVGFASVSTTAMTFGVVTIYVAVK